MPAATKFEFPMPANLRPSAPPPATPDAIYEGAPMKIPFMYALGQESFRLDSDLRLALEDMCQAAEGSRWRERWPEWLSVMVNDGLRGMLGR